MISLLNPWVMLAAVLALLAAVGGSFVFGHKVGSDAVTVKWQKQAADVQRAQADALAAAHAGVITAERRAAEQLAAASARYQVALKEKEDEKQLAVARAAARGLWVDTVDTCGGEAGNSEAPAPAGGRDGSARSRLSEEAAGFLIGEASRADQVVEQLKACQGVVLEDRKASAGS